MTITIDLSSGGIASIGLRDRAGLYTYIVDKREGVGKPRASSSSGDYLSSLCTSPIFFSLVELRVRALAAFSFRAKFEHVPWFVTHCI